jgi:ribokinase
MVKKFDVVVFGSGVVDVFASSDVGEKKGKLDLDIGSKYLIGNLKSDIGGGGTNVAVAFSRFGFKTECICGVGKDSNGKEILDCLKREGIGFLGRIGDGRSGYSFILDSRKNNRTIFTYKGESNEVSFGDIKRFKSDWIYFSSLLGKSFVAQKKLAREMVGNGSKLILNPSSYSIRKQDLKGLLKLSSVLILNKEEARSLLRKYRGDRKQVMGDRNLLEGLCKLGPGIVVVTDKDKATVCFDGENLYRVFPNKKKKVVERTGAGDAFGAGFVGGLIARMGIRESLKLGIKESEAVLGYFGAKNNLLKRKIK